MGGKLPCLCLPAANPNFPGRKLVLAERQDITGWISGLRHSDGPLFSSTDLSVPLLFGSLPSPTTITLTVISVTAVMGQGSCELQAQQK